MAERANRRKDAPLSERNANVAADERGVLYGFKV